ncbi:MAG: PAS domain S-box protein [Desulfobacteraceae bacterium]|nr:PAS domain S-box protein [Desulfobacteraceae bacterium]
MDTAKALELENSALKQELLESNLEKELHETLINAVDDPLFLINGSGILLKANAAAMERYGFQKGDLFHGTIWERLPPTLAKEWKEEIAKVIRKRSENRFQFDHGQRIKELLIWPAFDAKGRLSAFTLMEKDITRHIRALERHNLFQEEEACTDQQMLHASTLINLGTLVAGMAHEISNPNAFIMTNAPLLERLWTDLLETMDDRLEPAGIQAGGFTYQEIRETIPELLRGINDGASRIDIIVKSLRSFSRPDPYGALVPVCLNAVVKTALLFLNNEIRKSTKHFSTDLDRLLPSVAGIPQRLEQVIINLLLNACQALPRPDRKIILSTRTRENNAILTVTDEGCGIDQESLDRIFEPFFTTKTDIKGTGLGLSITKKIVKEHHGWIEFQSEPGLGTRVTVGFPAMKGE